MAVLLRRLLTVMVFTFALGNVVELKGPTHLFASEASGLSYRILASGAYCNQYQASLQTINSQVALHAHLQRYHAPALSTLGPIDFSKEFILAAYMGYKANSGYSYSVADLEWGHRGRARLKLIQTGPHNESPSGQGTCAPFIMIALSKNAQDPLVIIDRRP
jgi:hypothetical protein